MEFLAAHCTNIFSQHKFVLISFFVAGITGGFTHCITMCGPFIACQASCVSNSCNSKTSLLNGLGVSYHLGRATTYGTLGFICAFLSKQITYLKIWPVISATMLVIAGLIFLANSLPGCKHSLMENSGKLTYARGVLLGFMPCGLLYAALMMAATTANPFTGMVAMWMFVLGTVPALFFVRFGIGVLTKKYHSIMQKACRAMMVLNGLYLFVIAIKLVR